MLLSNSGSHTDPLYRHPPPTGQPDIHHADTRLMWERLLPSITVKINSFIIVEEIRVLQATL